MNIYFVEHQAMKERPIQLPALLLRQFCEYAFCHSPHEVMGWITGTIETKKGVGHSIVYCNGLFLPLQSGTNYSVQEPKTGDAPQEMLAHLESTSSVIVGWVHSHPTFDAFFSTVDQHMMWLLQRESPQSFGIVIDKDRKPRVLRLTDAAMEEVKCCFQDDSPMFPCFSARILP